MTDVKAPITSARQRSMVTREVQTEASFVPGCADLKYTYEPQASEQFTDLKALRDMIKSCMGDVAGCVFDVVSFKDIMFKIEEEFPTSLPVSDMLLLSSKLFRKTSELGRLLGCFFGVIFAEDHVDEHFHFAEIRILQQELLRVKKQLKESEEEKVRLQTMLANVGQMAADHGKAVELLEHHNEALQLQTSALEDQMALLFHQMNSDLEVNCKDAYEKVTLEMETQERLNPTRTTFRQTMDSLSQQMRSTRSLIGEVRETLLSCNQGMRTGENYVTVEPSVRFKLKMVDSNFQQLIGRFAAVKDTVAETAHELMNALHERKKILYLSFQHIRLYDLQNAKMRHGKAILTELRDYTKDLLKKLGATFPTGAITSVDRLGRITTQRWQGGYTLAALRQTKRGKAQASDNTSDMDEVQRMAAESELAAINSSRSVKQDDGTTEVVSGRLSASQNGRPGTGEVRSFALPAGGIKPPAAAFMEGADGEVETADPFDTIQLLVDVVRAIDADVEGLNTALTLEEEMSAFLKTLTLSVSSTARTDVAGVQGATTMEQLEGLYEDALLPTGSHGAPPPRLSAQEAGGTKDGGAKVLDNSLTDTDIGGQSTSRPNNKAASRGGASNASGVSKAEQAQSDALLARQAQQLLRQQEQLSKIQDDFSSRLGFLRQVYEARIADLEVKESSVKQRITAAAVEANESNGSKATTAASKKRIGRDAQLVREPHTGEGRDEELAKLRNKSDRDELLAARTEWKKTKSALQAGKDMRDATAQEIGRIETKSEQKRLKKTGERS